MDALRTLRWLWLMTIPLASCATKHRAPVAQADKAERSYPVIVSLVGRNEVITITAGPKSPLYSAKTKDGVVLVKSATLAQLRDEHPEIYQKVYPAITVQSDASDAIVGGYAGIGPD